MHFVYILYSLTRDKFYVGSCEDVNKRLTKHNTNHSGFTGKTGDWAINYIEEHPDKTSALKREKQIKAWKSRKKIEKLIEGFSPAGSAHPDLQSGGSLVYSDNMKMSANLNGPGNANEVILGDKLTRSGGGRLSEILPSLTFGVLWQGGLPFSPRASHIMGSKPMAIFIEGAQVSPSQLDDINPYDIHSIEVLRSINYLAIYGSNAPFGALIITLRHGTGETKSSHESVDGLITYNFNGYYKAREFYSPKYDSKNTTQVADDRKTIYWNPNIITDANGKASFEYFNAGSKGTYRVVIEGIDEDGNLGRQVFRFKVE